MKNSTVSIILMLQCCSSSSVLYLFDYDAVIAGAGEPQILKYRPDLQ